MTSTRARIASLLPAALMPSKELGPEQRWLLVGSLYKQKLSLVEGSLALAFLQIICWIWSGQAVFGVLAGGGMALLGIRLWFIFAFARRSGRYGPEQWARFFVVGGTATGALWGMTAVLALMRIHDAPLHTVVLIAEAGWAAGAAVRNAASPAAVLAQTVTTVCLSMIGSMATGIPIYRVAALFYVLMFTSLISVAHYLGRQLESQLLSQQRLADVNARLTVTCGELEQANARLEQLSATDALTGIGNRRAFDDALLREWSRAVRDGGVLSLLVIDVDLFKAFNDFYGHPAGDACLRIIADCIEQSLRRPPDFAGRFGGEEFVALLPGVDSAGALEVAERLRCAVIETPVPHARSPFAMVTVSVGAATVMPRAGINQMVLVDSADQALYRAKQAGRNRVEAAATPCAGADAGTPQLRGAMARLTVR